MVKHGPHDANGTDQSQTDEGHDSDRRGEHRYPDEHQRPEERRARQGRDDLKQRLQNHPPARS